MKDAATPAELVRARELLWAHLEAQHGWKQGRPTTWTDEAYAFVPGTPGQPTSHGLGGNPKAGLLSSTIHSDCFWYCRTLPGVLSAFATAYGTDDLVTAYVSERAPAPPAHLSLDDGAVNDEHSDVAVFSVGQHGGQPTSRLRAAQPAGHAYGAG